jgi:hypothetical protein
VGDVLNVTGRVHQRGGGLQIVVRSLADISRAAGLTVPVLDTPIQAGSDAAPSAFLSATQVGGSAALAPGGPEPPLIAAVIVAVGLLVLATGLLAWAGLRVWRARRAVDGLSGG